jgi:hypothetical protein
MGGTCSSDGELRGVYRVLVGNLRERDYLGDPGIDGRKILRWIFKKENDVRPKKHLSTYRAVKLNRLLSQLSTRDCCSEMDNDRVQSPKVIHLGKPKIHKLYIIRSNSFAK